MARRNPSRPIWPLLLMILGVLLIAGGAYWYANGSLNETSNAPAKTAPSDEAIPYPEIARVTVEEAKKALDAGSAVFVDVRGDPYYAEGHIPGALNISVNDFSERLGELESSAWIITYCT